VNQEHLSISIEILKPADLTLNTGPARRPAAFIGSQVYRKEAFGSHHPLSIPRVAGVMDMCAMLGWLGDEEFYDSRPAGQSQLTKFHEAHYVQALKRADEQGSVGKEVRERYRIGTMENPVFPGLFQRATTAVGGSILAAQLALEGKVAFHPAGGTHHGRPDRASGFCYFNDPVFSIMTLLDAGLERVLYVDLDAHHGDGVQDPRGFNDSELSYLMDNAVLQLGREFEPQALVITCGTDALDGDPLSGMALSNAGLWAAVECLLELCDRNVVLGGGGYNPWTVVRCWSGLWGRLSHREIPGLLPEDAQEFLRGLECDLVDEEDVRPEVLQ
jgi:acetoin utilization protein AcuC